MSEGWAECLRHLQDREASRVVAVAEGYARAGDRRKAIADVCNRRRIVEEMTLARRARWNGPCRPPAPPQRRIHPRSMRWRRARLPAVRLRSAAPSRREPVPSFDDESDQDYERARGLPPRFDYGRWRAARQRRVRARSAFGRAAGATSASASTRRCRGVRRIGADARTGRPCGLSQRLRTDPLEGAAVLRAKASAAHFERRTAGVTMTHIAPPANLY